jgi:hypothetical protein
MTVTVAELRETLSHYDDELPVYVRCAWEGDEPSSNVFALRLVTQDIDHSTNEDFLALECDQDA